MAGHKNISTVLSTPELRSTTCICFEQAAYMVWESPNPCPLDIYIVFYLGLGPHSSLDAQKNAGCYLPRVSLGKRLDQICAFQLMLYVPFACLCISLFIVLLPALCVCVQCSFRNIQSLPTSRTPLPCKLNEHVE